MSKEKFEEMMMDYAPYYGSEWLYVEEKVSRSELKTLDKRKSGAIKALWPPQTVDDDELRSVGIDINDDNNEWTVQYKLSQKLVVPVIWQNMNGKLSNEVHLEPFNQILITHHDILKIWLKQQEVVESYINKNIHKKVLKYMAKWRKENDPNPQKLKKGDMIRLNPRKVPFAYDFPIALILKINGRDYNLNIQIVHIEYENNKIVLLRDTIGWIDNNAISKILCVEIEETARKLAYTQELLENKQKQLRLKQKQCNEEKNDMLHNYFGKKVKKALNSTNYVGNRKNQKPVKIEQDMHRNYIISLIAILKKHKIPFDDNPKRELRIDVRTPSDLSRIIGSNNIQRTAKGYKYIPVYPITITYGYKLQFPRLHTNFRVQRTNVVGNVER